MPVRFSHLDSRNEETTESFFSRHFLEARIHSGQESNQDFDELFAEGRSREWLDSHWKEVRENDHRYEEDVNQYLTLTLAEWSHPGCLEMMNQCLVSLDSDVGQMAESLEERSRRYLMYKINADFLLFQLGLLNPGLSSRGDAYFDKGGAYYFSAASSLKGIKGGRSALSDVLEKLSGKFGKYVEVLRHMRRREDNYFSFHFKFTNEDMEILERMTRPPSDPEPPLLA